ncbi:cation:proton antiporter [Azovibrio restrictus]|uniref:cation:proton antiporter n=1 Tax=Azovibrio restrictus TaxID=146938 RepID=UPI0026F252FC|nr:cation:proton antiporter [Azovibrio restrictus]MDD3484187.1 cation:proton antiporter [Azovibrio restrictus]
MHTGLSTIVVVLSSGVLALMLARMLKLPPLIGYLAAGIALGPSGLAALPDNASTATLAEYGVVFLMFSIGLEFSLKRLQAMQGLVFGMGGAQMLVTVLGTTVLTVWYFHNPWQIGVATGAAVAMSSTAIVARLLSERLELNSQAGRQTMGVLLFQDLAVVPLLLIIPALASSADDLLPSLAKALAQAALVLVLLVVLGQRLMGRWLRVVVRQKSEELFMLNVLLVVMGLSWVTAEAGLSLALGAFVAGVLIAETVYRHQVEADIRPFRDVLLGLFFVTIGMQLDVAYVLGNLGRVLLVLCLLVAAKLLVMGGICWLAGNTRDIALRTSVQLAQAGEFGFVLIGVGVGNQLIPHDVHQVTTAAMLLSMFLAPLAINRVGKVRKGLSEDEFSRRARMVQDVASHSMECEQHVVLCGYGRVGQNLAGLLAAEGIGFVALDTDTHRLEEAARLGHNAVFGDADRKEVLQAAGLGRARAVVVTFDSLRAAERVLALVRHLHPTMPVILRARDQADADHLRAEGASAVVPEVIEGSFVLALETLTWLGVPGDRALERIQAVRRKRR